MQSLIRTDLQKVVRHLPVALLTILEEKQWRNRVYLGGGFIRTTLAGERVNDIDLFVGCQADSTELALRISAGVYNVIETKNAITIKTNTPVQIITRWNCENAEELLNSFDYTVCCAVVYRGNGVWHGCCDENFYPDLGAKVMSYRSPKREEDAAGSLLRLGKFIKKGYSVSTTSLAGVLARFVTGFKPYVDDQTGKLVSDEERVTEIAEQLFSEVDYRESFNQADEITGFAFAEKHKAPADDAPFSFNADTIPVDEPERAKPKRAKKSTPDRVRSFMLRPDYAKDHWSVKVTGTVDADEYPILSIQAFKHGYESEVVTIVRDFETETARNAAFESFRLDDAKRYAYAFSNLIEKPVDEEKVKRENQLRVLRKTIISLTSYGSYNYHPDNLEKVKGILKNYGSLLIADLCPAVYADVQLKLERLMRENPKK